MGWNAPVQRATFSGNTTGTWTVQARSTYHTLAVTCASPNLAGARIAFEGTHDGTNWFPIANFSATGSQVWRGHAYKMRAACTNHGGTSVVVTAVNAVDRATQEIPVADGSVSVTTVTPA